MSAASFDSWVEQARNVPIQRVIEQRGIRLNGKTDRSGPCPVCGGDDRFSINIQKQVFNCRGFGGGDVIALVEHLDGCDFVEACTTLSGKPPPKPNGRDRGAAPKSATRGVPKKIITATFEYHDENGAIVYVIERVEYQNTDGSYVLTKDGKHKKTFRQRRPDPEHPGEWVWNVDGVFRILYRLSEVIEAVASRHLIFIVEGEGKVDALQELGIAATTCPGGAGKWQPEMSERLRGADVVLLADNDEPGWRHVQEVGAALAGIASRTRVLVLPDLPAKGDVRDWLAAGGTRERVDALIEQAPDWQPPPDEAPADTDKDAGKDKAAASEQDLIDELARLSPVGYDRRREQSADQMGIRRGTLDEEVAARRRELAEAGRPPPLFSHWVVEPWPQSVDTGELILALVGRIKRHVILSDDEALAVALWILFAWAPYGSGAFAHPARDIGRG